MFMLKCIRCGSKFPDKTLKSRCTKCSGTLEYNPDHPVQGKIRFSGPIGFWRYRQMLPPVQHIISLGEGGTPLLKAERLSKEIGLKELYLKDETRNPTHSYRDRAAAFLTSNAVDLGCKALVSASNGNMGASIAAYSAKAGVICHVLVP